MKTLHKFIMEAAFNKETDDVKELYDKVKNPILPQELFNELVKGIKDITFIYSDKESYIKIPYIFRDDLIEKIESDKKKFGDILVVRQNNNLNSENEKVKFKYKMNSKWRLAIELGLGSVGKISTNKQEETTVNLYNNIANNLSESILENLAVDIENMCDDLLSEFNKSWKISFQKQINNIIKYIKEFNGNPADYRLAKYGEGPIGKAYDSMVKAHMKKYDLKVNRNVVDPTDIILYKKDAGVESKLKSINSIEDYRKELYQEKLCVGISLKKMKKNIDSSTPEFNNGSVHVTEVKNYSERQGKEDNKGYYFNVTVVFDNELLELGGELRNFNRDSGAALEFKPKKGDHKIGKVSVDVWREVIGAEEGDSLEKLQDKMATIIRSKGNEDILLKLVKMAFKEWDMGFPFILVH